MAPTGLAHASSTRLVLFEKAQLVSRVLSSSVTLGKKREPFLGKTFFSGAATQKKGKKGATEQLSVRFRNPPARQRLAGGPGAVPRHRGRLLRDGRKPPRRQKPTKSVRDAHEELLPLHLLLSPLKKKEE